METKSLFRALALLLAIVTAFMIPCALVGLAYGEALSSLWIYIPPCLIGLFCFVLAFTGNRHKTTLSPRTGYLFVTLGWLLSACLGSLPFVLSGCIPLFSSAFFEVMSGFSTTGATILADIEALPPSLLLWRACTHWLGGMGIVVLTVAIFPLLGLNGKALMEAEAPGPQVDKFTPRLSNTAAILWLIYLGLTVILFVLLLFGGMDFLEALTHSFATMATGGFSTRNASVGAWNSAYIDGIITLFMVLAGTNFALHWRFMQGKPLTVLRDSEWRLYLGIFFGSSIFISLSLADSGLYGSFAEAWRYASFQVASILTTTGFATADYLAWPSFAQAILFCLMFIGGSAGSTAGGIKVGRVVTLLKMGAAEMKYLLNPRGVYGIFVNRRYVHKNIVYDIAAMVFLFLSSVLVSTLVVSAAGFDILTSLSATLATIGNIGPGFSLVGPSFNYGFFPEWVKLWLSFVMLLGRLEIYTVLVLFTPAFWKR